MPRKSKPTNNESNGNQIAKPKRALSAYNLFYRYKRAKILTAHKAGDDSKETIIHITETTPGLEDHPDVVSIMTPSQLVELSRAEIRAALLDHLEPVDTSQRSHRKSHGAMTFLEMNKIMVGSWKSINDATRRIFEELAIEGRRIYQQRVAEFELLYPGAMEHPNAPKKKKVKRASSVENKTTAVPAVLPITTTMMKEKENPKAYARMVSDDDLMMQRSSSSPSSSLYYLDGMVPSSSTHHFSPSPNVVSYQAHAASAHMITPDNTSSKRTFAVSSFSLGVRDAAASSIPLPYPPASFTLAQPLVPENIASSYFDCLDFDLTSEESKQAISLDDVSDIFDDGLDCSSRSSASSMYVKDMGYNDAFPSSMPLYNGNQGEATRPPINRGCSVSNFVQFNALMDDITPLAI